MEPSYGPPYYRPPYGRDYQSSFQEAPNHPLSVVQADKSRLLRSADFASAATDYMFQSPDKTEGDPRPMAQFGKPLPPQSSPDTSYTTPSPVTSPEALPYSAGPTKLVQIRFPSGIPGEKQLHKKLKAFNVKYLHIRPLRNILWIVEFNHLIESVSFMRKTNGSFWSENDERNVCYFQVPPVVIFPQSYFEKFKMFTVPPGHQEISAEEAVFVISVSLETLTGHTPALGSVQSPCKICCFSNHGKLTAEVTPLQILKDDQLTLSAGLRRDGDRVVRNNQTEIRNENQAFIQNLYNLLARNLKCFGSSNPYEKAILQFLNWTGARIFLTWYELAGKISELSDVIFTVTVLDPEPGGADIQYDETDIEQRAMFLHYNIEEKIRRLGEMKKEREGIKKRNLVPLAEVVEEGHFIKLEDCVPIQILVRPKSVREEQILCFVVIWFKTGDGEQRISKIATTVNRSRGKNSKRTIQTKTFKSGSSEENMIKDFLKFVDDFVRVNGGLPVTLVSYSNTVTLSVVLDVVKRHCVDGDFFRIFRNCCDLRSIIDIRGENQQLPKVLNFSSEFLKKMCTNLLPAEDIFIDITKYSCPVPKIICKPIHPFPVELVFTDKDQIFSPGELRSLKINVEVDLLRFCPRENLRFLVNKRYPVTLMNPLLENNQVTLKVRAEKTFTLKQFSLLGVFIPKFESFVIPSNILFLGTVNIHQEQSSMDSVDITPVNFSLASDGANTRPGQSKEKEPATAPAASEAPPLTKLTSTASAGKETVMIPPPPPEIQLENIPPPVVKIEPYDDFHQNVFIHIENTDDEISSLDVMVNNEGRNSRFEKHVSVSGGSGSKVNDIAPVQVVTQMTDFLLSKVQIELQPLRLIMICPDTLQIFRAWVESHQTNSVSFSELFPSFATLATLVNDSTRSGLLKGTKLKKERLATYFENFTSTELSTEKPKTEAMKEVFEKLNVKDDQFEVMRITGTSHLLFFFHVDVIESEIVSLGFYNINQQQFLAPVKLSELSEQAKKLGFVSKTKYCAKHLKKDIDCKDEKTALVEFLSTIEMFSKNVKNEPVLVSLTIKEEMIKLFERFECHGLLQRAFKVISAVGSIEGFWQRTEQKRFGGLKDMLRELEKSFDINSLNSPMISKLCLDFLAHKLSSLPNSENFIIPHCHTLRSPFINTILRDVFLEDKYNIVSKTDIPLPSSLDMSVPIPVKIKAFENLGKNETLKVIPEKTFKKQSRTNITSGGEFEITVKKKTILKKMIKKGEVVATGSLDAKKVENSRVPPTSTPQKTSTRYRVYPEKTFDIKPGETRNMRSHPISKSLVDGTKVAIELRNDEGGKYVFQYEKVQKLEDGIRIKYFVKNISKSGKQSIKIDKDEKIGHLTVIRSDTGKKQKSKTEDLSMMKDTVSDLTEKYPGHHSFISEAVQHCLKEGCKDVAGTIESAVLEIDAWIKKPPSKILEILMKELKGEQCDGDVSRAFYNQFPHAEFAQHGQLISRVFVKIYHSKYSKVKKEVKEEQVEHEDKMEVETEKMEEGSLVSVGKKEEKSTFKGKVRVREFAKMCQGSTSEAETPPSTSSEYVEEEFDSEEKEIVLHPTLDKETDEPEDSIAELEDDIVAPDQNQPIPSSDESDVQVLKFKQRPEVSEVDNETVLVNTVDTSTESNGNSAIAAQYFPEKKKEPKVTLRTSVDATVDEYFPRSSDDPLLNLPFPCPVKATPAKKSKDKSVPEKFASENDVPVPVILGNTDSPPCQAEERIIRRVEVEETSTQKSSTPRRKIVFTSEPETDKEKDIQSNNNSERYGVCPHFEDELKQISCIKCNSLRRGKVKCCHIVTPIYSKNFCRFEMTLESGCLRTETCEKNHQLPEHLPDKFQFCENFLQRKCQSSPDECELPHLTFGVFNLKLKEEIEILRDHCKICEENYKEEYKVLEKRRKGKKRRRDKEIICEHFLKGKCSYGDSCFKIHDIREKLARMSEK